LHPALNAPSCTHWINPLGVAVRRTLLVIAVVLLVAAAVLLAVGLAEHGDWAKPTIASVWAGLNANSLVGFGALVEQKIDPDLWFDVLLPLLTWPAWSAPGIVGVIVLAIGLLVRAKPRPETETRPA
jgi:uncharacterized membrane protein YphA (DoxX/SURF4 family)